RTAEGIREARRGSAPRRVSATSRRLGVDRRGRRRRAVRLGGAGDPARGGARLRQGERVRRGRRGARRLRAGGCRGGAGGWRPRQGRPGRSASAQGYDGGGPCENRVVAVTAVVFDVGETLVDETAMWERAADACGVPRFTLMGVLGGLAARGEDHRRVWSLLG